MNQLNTGETLPPSAQPVFCVDCKHISHPKGEGPTCQAPQTRLVNLVTGYYGPACRIARVHGACGPAGKLYEAAKDGSGTKLTISDTDRAMIISEMALPPNLANLINNGVTELDRKSAQDLANWMKKPLLNLTSHSSKTEGEDEAKKKLIRSMCLTYIPDTKMVEKTYGPDHPRTKAVKKHCLGKLTKYTFEIADELCRFIDQAEASQSSKEAILPGEIVDKIRAGTMRPLTPVTDAQSTSPGPRAPYARMSVAENNRRSLQVRCHAALEDIVAAVESHGPDSPQAQAVKARYVSSLTSNPIPFLEEAIKSLDRDHAWPRHV